MLAHSSHTEARMVLVSGVSMLVGEALTVMVVAARLVRRRRMVEGCIVALADVVLRLVGCSSCCGLWVVVYEYALGRESMVYMWYSKCRVRSGV
jgi:hypothetical protein